jgi:hypothetical protein
MFISKSERMEISQRLYVLEEMVKSLNGKMTDLESTLRDSTLINKKTLLVHAEKLNKQREKQREYSRRYHAKVRAQKAAQ